MPSVRAVWLARRICVACWIGDVSMFQWYRTRHGVVTRRNIRREIVINIVSMPSVRAVWLARGIFSSGEDRADCFNALGAGGVARAPWLIVLIGIIGVFQCPRCGRCGSRGGGTVYLYTDRKFQCPRCGRCGSRGGSTIGENQGDGRFNALGAGGVARAAPGDEAKSEALHDAENAANLRAVWLARCHRVSVRLIAASFNALGAGGVARARCWTP